jgi:magnesium-transporting ATPase (P-type)
MKKRDRIYEKAFLQKHVISMPQFYFLFFSGYSVQTIFDDWYITFYNMLFTSMPVVVRAILDQDLNYKKWSRQQASEGTKELAERENLKRNYPIVYMENKKSPYFNGWNFLFWFLQGIIHSMLIFAVCREALRDSILEQGGEVFDMWYFSLTIYTASILVVDVKLALFTRYWTFLNCTTLLFLSIGVFFGYMFLVDSFDYFLVFNTAFQLFTTFHYGLLVVGLAFLIFSFDLFCVLIKKECFPTVTSLYVQIVKSKREKVSRVSVIGSFSLKAQNSSASICITF